MDGYDLNDTTIHTIPLKALLFEYLEYYPEYNKITIDRLISEIPMTFVMMKYSEKSGLSIPDFLKAILKETDESSDMIALNNAVINQPSRFLAMNCEKYYPEFFKENKEAAIASSASHDGYFFLSNYYESHPQFIEVAIAHAVENEPFGLALSAAKFYDKYPAEVLKAIQTIASNDYTLYLKMFSADYPQFISN